jgi:hypothetical protein
LTSPNANFLAISGFFGLNRKFTQNLFEIVAGKKNVMKNKRKWAGLMVYVNQMFAYITRPGKELFYN